MYSFKNDYSEGAHPRILETLVCSNLEQTTGYGEDYYCEKAKEILKEKLDDNNVDIHFLVGGTQVNLTAISAFLRPHEAVIAAQTSHVFVHETGAIEATGHKVVTTDVPDGKLTPCDIQKVLDAHTDEHMVKPKMVYISNSTEVGTIYTKQELENLSIFCKKHKLFLYMDGARLGSALSLAENDLCLADFVRLTDAFYIGGTKNGALMGEALVIVKDGLKEDFRYHIKQKGALLAKGRLLGIQFLELFKDNLYFEIAGHANKMADLLRSALIQSGYSFYVNSPSNQIFPILPNDLIKNLREKYEFSDWEKIDETHSAIRLVTSWATREDAVEQFIQDIL